jgi:uncharacterized membrane protein YtjA (UPF0391 family)
MSVWSLRARNRKKNEFAEIAPARIDQIYLAHSSRGGFMLLRWALLFFVLALMASVFGFLGIAAAALAIAKILFFVFLVLFLGSVLGGLLRRSRAPIGHYEMRSKETS